MAKISVSVYTTLKPVVFLSIGLISGWVLHAFVYKQEGFSPDIEIITLEEILPRQRVDPSPQASLQTDQSDPQRLSENETKTNANPLKAGLTQFESALDRREADLAVSICNGLFNAGQKECRQKLFDLNQSQEANEGFIDEILNLWLFDHPEDLEVTMILVDRAMEEERFVEAARRLAFVRGYQTDPDAIESVSWQVQRLARAAMMKLNLREDFVNLKAILEIFTEIEPNRPTWRYSLARILIEMNDFDGALEALTYILFDPDYGDRANEMYERVRQRINLASYSVASLQRIGAQFLVSARLNGIHELVLLLDTGASLTSINAQKLKQLGLLNKPGQEILLNTAGGQIRSTLVQLNSLSVGGQPIEGLSVASLEYFDGEADGLLGMDYLRHFKFVIDQSNRSLHLTPK